MQLSKESMNQIIKIYGERNTLTNYASQIIALNLTAQELPGVIPDALKYLQKKAPGNQWLRDLYFALSYHRNLGWKHSKVMSAEHLQSFSVVRPRLAFLTITKNPYSWLLSMHRRPYNTNFSRPDKFEEFLSMEWKTFPRDRCIRVLENPMQLWNIKNSAYLAIAGGTLNVLNQTAEAILADPALFISQFGQQFSIPPKTTSFVNIERSTKNENRTFADYQHYYGNEEWRKRLSKEAIGIINQHIDQDLMQRFGYQILE